MRWAIFYADSRVPVVSLLGEESELAAAPWLGVIAIVQDDPQRPNETMILHQENNYWWRPDWGRWQSGDDFGFMQCSAMYGARYLKKGETIRGEDNREIMGKAVDLKQLWDNQ